MWDCSHCFMMLQNSINRPSEMFSHTVRIKTDVLHSVCDELIQLNSRKKDKVCCDTVSTVC